MSHEYSAVKNNHRGHPKVNTDKYMTSFGEPRDVVSRDTPPALEAELLEDSFVMRKHFRYVAERLRHHHS